MLRRQDVACYGFLFRRHPQLSQLVLIPRNRAYDHRTHQEFFQGDVVFSLGEINGDFGVPSWTDDAHRRLDFEHLRRRRLDFEGHDRAAAASSRVREIYDLHRVPRRIGDIERQTVSGRNVQVGSVIGLIITRRHVPITFYTAVEFYKFRARFNAASYIFVSRVAQYRLLTRVRMINTPFILRSGGDL